MIAGLDALIYILNTLFVCTGSLEYNTVDHYKTEHQLRVRTVQ